jgi:branched-chain amino acid transport system ATP-binding protein
MILETKGLSKSFGSLAALVEVDLSIEEGMVFGIAGPNGAGKSTLFNVIAGVYPPSAGQIVFEDEDITRLGPHQTCRRGLARTFQIPKTFPSLSVYDNVRVGATFGSDGGGRVIKQRVEETLEFLGLSDQHHQKASNLDLYTTKLVMLGVAMATGCKLLMLDEPLAGLSIVEIHDFLELVGRINKDKRVTVIIIEHLLDHLINVSQWMVILHNGSAIYAGDPSGVRQDREVVEVYLGGARRRHERPDVDR